MGFFDDIFIPTENFQPNTVFNKAEQLWAWHYAGAELFLDIEEVPTCITCPPLASMSTDAAMRSGTR